MRRFGLFVVLFALGVTPARSDACSVPVFRYALERWKPTPYEVYLFHQGALQGDSAKLAGQLEEASGKANVNVIQVDLAGKPTAAQQKMWELHGKGATTPWVMVRFPEDEEKAPPAWAGPLDAQRVALLLDSPARREVVKRLCRGDSAVWVLLQSSDKKADDEAARLLERELARLQKTIKLPEQEADGTLLSQLPLRVSFPVVRLERNAPLEEVFVQMLLGSDEDLTKAKGPIAIPIFGRGRALLALTGKDLTAAQIERWASFLCGACSCQVKELNPGVDLLIQASWSELLEAAEEQPAVAPAKQAVTAPAIPPGPVTQTEVKPVEKPAEEEAAAPPAPTRWWLWGGAAVLVVLAGAWALRTARPGDHV